MSGRARRTGTSTTRSLSALSRTTPACTTGNALAMEKTADRSTGSPAADTLPEAVTRALTAYWSLAEAGQIPPAIGGEIAVRIHSDCAVARVPAWAGRPRAFLKMFREQTALQREVEGLRRGGSVAPDSPVAVPKVLQVVPAENAVLMEYVHGRPLDSLLRRGLIHPSAHVGHV